MLRRAGAILAFAAFGLVPFLSGGAVASAAHPWVATHTQGLSLTQAKDLGPATSTTPMHISVALALRHQQLLQSYIRSVNTAGSPMYGQSLTPAQFTARFGPTASQVDQVKNYLAGEGFSGIHASGNHIYVTAAGTAAQVDKAFNTKIDAFLQNGQKVYANVQPAMVPAVYGQFIVAVLGLSNAIKMSFPATPKTEATPNVPNVPNSYWAPGFQKAYGASGTVSAKKTAIAIFAEGDVTQVVKDLRLYEKDPNNVHCSNPKDPSTCAHLPRVPVSVVHTGIPSTDTAGLTEFDMDTQTSTGLAGDVKRLFIYDATSLTDGDVALEFNSFVTQDKAKAGSASFGECEYLAYLDGFMVANDEAMAEAAAQGQTVFASAGDSGGFCAVTGLTNGVPGGEPFVNYPASSPYVTAAGGTTLTTNTDGSYNEELAWVAGGGGPSYFEYQPYWQTGVAPPTGTSCVAQVPVCLGRDVPDVAMDADFLLSAANFYSAGAPTSNGGTSLASPLSLGSWARIETAHNNKIGFASPNLYAAAGTSGFHDVTLGDTGPYPATPGWDYATGNGSFDIGQMIKQIAKPPAKITKTPVPSPACTLFYDPTGDANPIGSTGNVDSLDIVSGGISTDSGKKTLTGVLRVKSLNDGPGGTPEIAGTGDTWYLLFGYQGTTYFFEATYDPSTLAKYAFNYGHITKSPSGGTQYNPDGTATGTVDAAHGLISITAPWTAFGPQLTPKVTPPALKSILDHPSAQTFEEVGTNASGGLLEGADSASGNTSYVVGTNC